MKERVLETSIQRQKVLEEIAELPDASLGELLDLLHSFRNSPPGTDDNAALIMGFAGRLADMEKAVFDGLQTEVTDRRKRAFSGRRSVERGSR